MSKTGTGVLEESKLRLKGNGIKKNDVNKI